MEGQRRYTDEWLKRPDAGLFGAAIQEDVTYAGRPWVVDYPGPYGMLFGVSSETLERYIEDAGSWSDDDGSILHRRENSEAYEARFRLYDNIHNAQPNASFRLDGITATVDNIHTF
jgi:hypothetical protein